MTSKSLLDNFFSDDDYDLLGQAICKGYSACREHMRSSPVLWNFPPGRDQWSQLIRTFVEKALSDAPIAGWYSEYPLYTQRNGRYTRFSKNGLTLTSHFVGYGTNRRDDARRAVYRAELADRNLDLFSNVEKPKVSEQTPTYCKILHGGYVGKIPEVAMLAIPVGDQRELLTPLKLPVTEPIDAPVEEIEDRIETRLFKGHDDEKEKSTS